MKEGRREQCTGSVDFHKGKHRVRVRVPGEGQKTLGHYVTEGEAHRTLEAYLRAAAASGIAISTSQTVRKFGEVYLDMREAANKGPIPTTRECWTQVEALADFIDDAVVDVTKRDVRELARKLRKQKVRYPWKHKRNGQPWSTSRCNNVLVLVRQIFAHATDEELILENPAYGVKLPALKNERVDHREEDHYLEMAHQDAFVACGTIPDWARAMILFAMYTGLRQGELYNLHLVDLVVDGDKPHVMVRFGSPGRLPKYGKVRRVPLFGRGLDVARRWLEALPTFAKENPLGLVFPREGGALRQKGYPKEWPAWRAMAGIGDEFRWHDLRHTCGTALLAGWWGRKWSKVEVQAMLGHRSVTTTERYAHITGSLADEAARETELAILAAMPLPVPTTPEPAPAASDGVSQVRSQVRSLKGKGSRKSLSHLGDLNSRPTVYETLRLLNGIQCLEASDLTGTSLDDGRDLASRLVVAQAKGKAIAATLARRLALLVLGAREFGWAAEVLAGGPHASTRALDLAELVLDLDDKDETAEPAPNVIPIRGRR